MTMMTMMMMSVGRTMAGIAVSPEAVVAATRKTAHSVIACRVLMA